MSTVTDHTDLADGVEFTTDPAAETLVLTTTGDLVDAGGSGGGVLVAALASALEDAFQNGTDHNKFRYPYFLRNEGGTTLEAWGGTTLDSGDLKFLRTGGYRERSGFGSTATITKEYACLVGLGTLASGTNQTYIKRTNDTTPQNLSYTGMPNELVLIYDSGGNDDRAASLEIFLREWGNTFVYYDLHTSQDITTLLPAVYQIPMTTTAETNGSGTNGAMQTTAFIDANTPYTGMGPSGNGSDLYETLAGTGYSAAAVETLSANDVRQDTAGRWFICTVGGTVDAAGVADYTANGGTATLGAYTGERQVNGTYYAYKYIHDANGGTDNQYWEYHQRSSIKTTDVDSSASVTQRGDLMPPVLSWVNGRMTTATGHYIDNLATADQPYVDQVDMSGTARSPSIVPVVEISVSDTFQADANGWYRMVFEDGSGSQDFDTSGAVTVNDSAGSAIAGTSADVTGSAGAYKISTTFDYSGNTQAGLTANTDKDVVFICGGNGTQGGARYAKVHFTITNSALVSAVTEAEEETTGS